MEDLVAFTIQVGSLLSLGLLAGLAARRLRPAPFLAALALAAVDFVLTGFTGELPGLQIPGLHWNWVGKAATALFSGVLLLLLPALRIPAGATLSQRPGSLWPGLSALWVLLAAAIWSGTFADPKPFSPETLLFQATMPSLAEEVVFRGTVLALLRRAYGDDDPPEPHRVGFAALVVAAWFGVGHAVYPADGGVQVSWFLLGFTGAVGVVLLFLRLATGSLLLPILGHSLFNVAISAVPMLR